MGSCVFKAGYTLYADTCIGRCIHNRYVSSFQRHFGENALHSKLTPFFFNELLVLPIPVLMNNYAYLVGDLSEYIFVLVDVGDASVIKKMNILPEAVLTTHKHWDHSGGNRLMRTKFPNLRIYGGALDRVPDSTDSVEDGQELRFGQLRFTAMWTPGHTKGHTVWKLDGSQFGCADSVFTGDLLMLGGCGAAFEGPVKQMNSSLGLVKQLPDETMVWPGHEMALENLELAAFIEPDNMTAVLKLVWAFNQRELRMCTCPSTVGEEKLYNPFLRTTDPQLLWALGILDRTRCPNHPMTEDQVAELCFDTIVHKCMQMNQMKKDVQYAPSRVIVQPGTEQPQDQTNTTQQQSQAGSQVDAGTTVVTAIPAGTATTTTASVVSGDTKATTASAVSAGTKTTTASAVSTGTKTTTANSAGTAKPVAGFIAIKVVS